jgi:hypothetical protein
MRRGGRSHASVASVSLLLIVTAAGCSRSHDVAEPYDGYYRSGFESSSFHPDGVREQWWLKGTITCSGLNVGPDIQGFPASNWVRLSVQGTLSDVGAYGHMGAYQRELSVQQVLSCRSLRPGERVDL